MESEVTTADCLAEIIVRRLDAYLNRRELVAKSEEGWFADAYVEEARRERIEASVEDARRELVEAITLMAAR